MYFCVLAQHPLVLSHYQVSPSSFYISIIFFFFFKAYFRNTRKETSQQVVFIYFFFLIFILCVYSHVQFSATFTTLTAPLLPPFPSLFYCPSTPSLILFLSPSFSWTLEMSGPVAQYFCPVSCQVQLGWDRIRARLTHHRVPPTPELLKNSSVCIFVYLSAFISLSLSLSIFFPSFFSICLLQICSSVIATPHFSFCSLPVISLSPLKSFSFLPSPFPHLYSLTPTENSLTHSCKARWSAGYIGCVVSLVWTRCP